MILAVQQPPDLLSSPTPAPVSESGMLGTRVDTIIADSKARLGATLGVVIWDLETDVLVERNSQRPFPMGSSARLAYAFGLFSRMDRGEVDFFDVQPQLARSLIDDNVAASDEVFALAGGADAINAALRDAGVTAMLIRTNAGGAAADVAAGKTFSEGGDNAASPTALALLLSEIARGEVLHPQSRLRLIDLLAQSTQLPDGFRAGLPPGTRVAQIPGLTLDGVSEAAIAQINGRGVVIVAMLSGTTAPPPQRAAILSSVARAAFDATARVVP